MRCLALALICSCLTALTGCDSAPKKSPIKGTVTWKGDPVKLGTINFRSEDGKNFASGEIKDGKYEIPAISGLPAGKYAVAISYPDPKAPAPKEGEAPGESTMARQLLPSKYTDGTELKVDIKDGPNDSVNFDLK